MKVVLAAAMWNNPHLLVLDEPTNFLDRESLGALASAIQEFAGGVIMISHNSGGPATLPASPADSRYPGVVRPLHFLSGEVWKVKRVGNCVVALVLVECPSKSVR